MNAQQTDGTCAKNVLIVDDDEDFCVSIQELLNANGYHVDTTASGTSALEWLAAEGRPRPCAIVVDLRMPDMDGYAFLNACSVEPLLPDIPVIVVTAFGAATGIAPRVSPKPVNVTRLLRSLQQAC